jgi:hypothetical protein
MIAILIGFLLVIGFLAGCGGGNHSATDKFRGSTDGSWTVLVYLNADNDLEPYGILNMNQMETVGSTDKLKIVVQMDRHPNYSSADGNWTGCKRFLVTKDTQNSEVTVSGPINSTVLEDMGEVDMGNPNTLRDFIRWGQTNYPADNYCLVIWNHGSGWRSAKTFAMTTVPRNVSFDDTSGTSINTADLPSGLAGSPEPINLIAMDASLMQMVEVAYELRNSAPLLVASEESPPGDGYPYDKWLIKLAANTGMSARELGTVIAQEYVNWYASPSHEYPVTQSLIDLSQIRGVAEATDDLAAAMLPHLATDADAIRNARQNAQSYAFSFYKDLQDYASLINQTIPDPAISAAYNKLKTAMSSAVLFEAHAGSDMARSHGLSLYVPAPGEYTEYMIRYKNLSFTKDFPNWAEVITGQKQ